MHPSLPVTDYNEGNALIFNDLPSYLITSNFYPQLTALQVSSYDGASLDDATTTMAMATDRSLVASKNHRDAERRRRERIKSHLDHLRCVLACSPKTDKASILAKAVERVKHLKQQTSHVSDNTNLLPTENDEIVVLPISTSSTNSGKRLVFEASLCCDDRSNLLTDITETLQSLQLKTLRAEIATLGGRIRNVIVVAKEIEEQNCVDNHDAEGAFLMDALRSLVVPSEEKKRRRLDHQTSEY